MGKLIKWGILGPGAVSRLFAEGLRSAAGAQIEAVGSRSPERARRFASEFGVRHWYGSYTEMLRHPGIEAVYVGTPHSFHREHTMLCLEAGRNVLCEKPFAINAPQAKEMAEEARSRNLALMEAMWIRFLPALKRVVELIGEGAIGKVREVRADFGFRAEFDPGNRLFDPALGGGALLDVGVYPVTLAHMILGRPDTVEATARIGETGVDEESGARFGYEDGSGAVLTMSISRETSCDALITGAEGAISIPAPWWQSERFMLAHGSGKQKSFHLSYRGNGHTHQAEEFMNIIRMGKKESEIMPLDDSISVMESLDRIREISGLRYPMEGRL